MLLSRQWLWFVGALIFSPSSCMLILCGHECPGKTLRCYSIVKSMMITNSELIKWLYSGCVFVGWLNIFLTNSLSLWLWKKE